MHNRTEDAIDHLRLKALQSLQRPEGPAVLDSLLQLFVDGTPKLLEQMSGAAANHDRSALRVAAHTLKSSSANLGALAFAEKGRRVEIESETADWSTLQSWIDDLATAAPSVTEALREAIRNIS